MTEQQKQAIVEMSAQLHQLGMKHRDPQLFYIAEEIKRILKQTP